MSHTRIGDACACIQDPSGKNVYNKIGAAFKNERGEISIKIDTLPLRQERWEGWVNIFPLRKPSDPDDDIPF